MPENRWLTYVVVDRHEGQPEHEELVGLAYDASARDARFVCFGPPNYGGPECSVNEARIEGGRVHLTRTSIYVFQQAQLAELHTTGRLRHGPYLFVLLPAAGGLSSDLNALTEFLDGEASRLRAISARIGLGGGAHEEGALQLIDRLRVAMAKARSRVAPKAGVDVAREALAKLTPAERNQLFMELGTCACARLAEAAQRQPEAAVGSLLGAAVGLLAKGAVQREAKRQIEKALGTVTVSDEELRQLLDSRR